MTCARCGIEIQPGAQWCPRCGSSLAAPPPAPAPPPGFGAPAAYAPAAASAAPPYAAAPAAYAASSAPAAAAAACAASSAPAVAWAAPPAPAPPPAAAPPTPAARPFSPAARILACEQCGAGVTVPAAGGTVSCSACGAALTAPPRPTTTVPPSPPADERARIERLRLQDGRPLLPPPGLESLLSGGALAQFRLNEARLVWGQTRRHLLANPSDLAAAERLMFLTIALSNAISDRPDADGLLRPLCEGALEALTLPRHRQVMRGMLTRRAARTGDVESAREWLAGCDPGSEDLMTDSAYRLSVAVVATMSGDPGTVVRVLGRTAMEVPTEDSLDAMAAILRANAVEKLGDVAGARVLLLQFAQGQGMGVVEACAKAFPAHLQICAQSLAAARGEHRQRVAQSAGGTGWVGWVILLAGCTPIVIVLPMILFGDAPIWVAIFAIVFPVAFGGWGLKMIKGARRSRLIARSGLQGTARIVAVNLTGTYINNVPMMRIDMQVNVPNYPPVQASTTKLLAPHNAAGLVGGTVNVLWYPSYPQDVVIEE